MTESTATPLPLTIGLDLGARKTHACILGTDGEPQEERAIATSREGISALLERHVGARVVLEASTPARWIAALAKKRGHEVIVANPRNIPLLTASSRKSDRNDAKLLAKLGRVQPELLSPVELRDDRYQAVRTLLFARRQLVTQRTALINCVRAEVRVLGHSLPSVGSRLFASKCRGSIPRELEPALLPLLDVIEMLTARIADFDRQVEQISKESFPETAILRLVYGVGPLIALAFVATIGDPRRFKRSRSVGAYFGLVPRSSQSGNRNPTLSISKEGDRFMRSLLVSAATRILRDNGKDCDLKRIGDRIAKGGDKRSKAKARIAVARRLAVLMHRLLVTGEVYEPLRNSESQAA